MPFFNLSFQEEKVRLKPQFKENSMNGNKVFHSALKHHIQAEEVFQRKYCHLELLDRKENGSCLLLARAVAHSSALCCVGTQP